MRQRVGHAAVAPTAHQLGHHHVVALQPASLALPGRAVRRMRHQRLSHGVPMPADAMGAMSPESVAMGHCTQLV